MPERSGHSAGGGRVPLTLPGPEMGAKAGSRLLVEELCLLSG